MISITKDADLDIEKTISSITNQQNVKMEHIIIDSVSSDVTFQIISKYKDRLDLKLISKPDDGISNAFNKGIKPFYG